jgi:hypothetical protein
MATQPQHATPSHASSEPPSGKSIADHQVDHLEVVRTVSQVPGNSHYYEKDGLRTYGDDEDHDHEPPVRFHLHGVNNTNEYLLLG